MFEKCVGRRVLISIAPFYSVCEAVVLEVSPSGRYAKVKFTDGREVWIRTDDWSVEEVLSSW